MSSLVLNRTNKKVHNTRTIFIIALRGDVWTQRTSQTPPLFFIDVTVPRQESEWACIGAFWESILSLFLRFWNCIFSLKTFYVPFIIISSFLLLFFSFFLYLMYCIQLTTISIFINRDVVILSCYKLFIGFFALCVGSSFDII